MSHVPVLLQEVITGLALQPGEVFVDATLNRAGHSRALCPALGPTGVLLGIDADGTAVREAEAQLAECPCLVRLATANFRHLSQVLASQGLGHINAILFDLGFSSDELERSGRGFSFLRDEPLLMTYASEPGERTAASIVNSWSERRLAQMLREYGEERFAGPIAHALVAARRRERLMTTGQLVAVIESAVPAWYRRRRLHPATKTFQALRIAVNDELDALADGLAAAWQALAPGGRLAVITFHGLEARYVRTFMQAKRRAEGAKLVARLVTPTAAELLANPRSRSAQLRIISKQL